MLVREHKIAKNARLVHSNDLLEMRFKNREGETCRFILMVSRRGVDERLSCATVCMSRVGKKNRAQGIDVRHIMRCDRLLSPSLSLSLPPRLSFSVLLSATALSSFPYHLLSLSSHIHPTRIHPCVRAEVLKKKKKKRVYHRPQSSSIFPSTCLFFSFTEREREW